MCALEVCATAKQSRYAHGFATLGSADSCPRYGIDAVRKRAHRPVTPHEVGHAGVETAETPRIGAGPRRTVRAISVGVIGREGVVVSAPMHRGVGPGAPI